MASFMLVVTGCSNKNTVSYSTTLSDAVVTEQKEEENGQIESESKDDEKNNDLIQITDNRYNDSFNTEDGRYSIIMKESEADSTTLNCIAYVDYKTAQQILLCNKPNCKHDNENCSAVLPVEIQFTQQVYLFGEGEYLYLASTPYDNAGSSVVTEYKESDTGMINIENDNGTPPALYRMKLDGTEREKIYTLSDNLVLEGQFFSDGKYFYTVTKKLQSESKENITYIKGYDKKLIRIDVQNGKAQDVLSLDTEAEILGCSGRNLILGVTDYGRELTPEEKLDNKTYFEAYKNSMYKITSVNIDTKENTLIKEIPQTQLHSEFIKNGYLYISYEKDTGIQKIQLATGEETMIPTEKKYHIDYEINGTLLGAEWDAEEKYHYDFIDTATGEIRECTLQTSEGTPVTIISENSDSLFVLYDFVNKEEYIPWANVTQELIDKSYYGMIKKSDYLNNVGEYRQVTMKEVM